MPGDWERGAAYVVHKSAREFNIVRTTPSPQELSNLLIFLINNVYIAEI